MTDHNPFADTNLTDDSGIVHDNGYHYIMFKGNTIDNILFHLNKRLSFMRQDAVDFKVGSPLHRQALEEIAELEASVAHYEAQHTTETTENVQDCAATEDETVSSDDVTEDVPMFEGLSIEEFAIKQAVRIHDLENDVHNLTQMVKTLSGMLNDHLNAHHEETYG